MGVTAQHLLTALFNAGIAISIGATVLSLGMTYTVGQLVAPLHRVVLVIAMVVLNAGVVPAVAWGLAEILPVIPSTCRALCWPPSARVAQPG
jgi:predicted Na+-dependent transporter